MKKIICIALAALMMAGTVSSTGFAYHGWHGGRGHVGVWVGPGWGWWGWPYYPYYPSYPYPYYDAPPVVIEEQPDTYIQQTPQAEAPTYWYFCRKPEGYYPHVKKCPKGWLKVVPPSTPKDKEE